MIDSNSINKDRKIEVTAKNSTFVGWAIFLIIPLGLLLYLKDLILSFFSNYMATDAMIIVILIFYLSILFFAIYDFYKELIYDIYRESWCSVDTSINKKIAHIIVIFFLLIFPIVFVYFLYNLMVDLSYGVYEENGNFFLIVFYIAIFLAIKKFHPEKSACVFLWAGIFLITVGIEIEGSKLVGFYKGIITLTGFALAVMGHYYVSDNAYKKVLKEK